MSPFVLDTDMLTLYYRGDATVVRNIQARVSTVLATTIVMIDERLTG